MGMEYSRFAATTEDLLDSYAAVVRRRGPAQTRNLIVREASRGGRQLLGYMAVGSPEGDRTLIDMAERDDFAGADDFDPRYAIALAWVLAYQQERPQDAELAFRIYEFVTSRFGAKVLPFGHRRNHVQLAFTLGYYDRSKKLLSYYRNIPRIDYLAAELDLCNPEHGKRASWEAWCDKLAEATLPAELRVVPGAGATPFDSITSAPLRSYWGGSLVTVAVTCYKPGEELLTSVRSILNQSWRNLEILIVDDGSPSAHRQVLKQAAALDERARLVELGENGGTYAARNAAIDLAAGEFLTFQDSDDWAHPDRIRVQAEQMQADPSLMLTVTNSIKISADLLVQEVGRPTYTTNMPSTMIRLNEVRARVGYFHNIRKSADREYIMRVGAAFGERSSKHDEQFLGLVRKSTGSLSQGDFRPGGWVHPARQAYRSSYGYWHSKIAAGTADPYVAKGTTPDELDVRPHLLTNGKLEPESKRYDLVYALDWRPYGGPIKSAIEEIRALKAQGRSIGILQLGAFRNAYMSVKPVCPQVQALINDKVVERVMPMDDVETDTLLIRYPPVLQNLETRPIGLRSKRVFVIANQAPMERDGTDVRYLPTDCSAYAEAVFGQRPIWVPQGPMVRAALESEGSLAPEEIAPVDFPGIVDLDEWSLPRDRFRGTVPAIGRHSRDHYTKWPADVGDLLASYPEGRDFDVRVMGGGKTPLAVLGRRSLPPNWISYDYDELPIKAFLYQLDFWVYFPNPIMVEAFGRAVLEAMAAGCVVVLPDHFADTFGEGAVYCDPIDVVKIVGELYSDFDRFREQSDRGREFVRRNFSADRFLENLARCEADWDASAAMAGSTRA